LFPPTLLSFYSTTYWKASFGRLRKLSSRWYRGSSRVPTFTWKFLNAQVQAICDCFPVFAIKRIYFKWQTVFQAAHETRNKKKFGKNFSQIFNLHYWLMTKNKSVWRTPTSEMKIIKSSLFITKEKSTSKCQNLNKPSITFPRERLFPRRMKAIFRYRSNKVSEFPRVYRPRTSQDSHIDGGRMNRDSGRSWIPRADRKLRSAVPSRLVKHFYDERLEVPVGWAIRDRSSVKIVRSITTWRGRNGKKKQRRKRRIIPRARRPQRARTRISLRPAVLRVLRVSRFAFLPLSRLCASSN